MHKIQLSKGDLVKVIAGDDIGKTGKVMRVDRKQGKVYVQGVNMQKKHRKADQQSNRPGGIIEREGPVHPSNVKLVK